ncbi:MAG: VCBS repeat-containing protein, partial [Planctomycetes bacterium]|nr:VCBS repeat-containing protein [Planctomycetota bacterium]
SGAASAGLVNFAAANAIVLSLPEDLSGTLTLTVTHHSGSAAIGAASETTSGFQLVRPPLVNSLVPSSNTASASNTAPIVASFSRPIGQTSVNGNSFIVQSAQRGALSAGSVAYSVQSQQVAASIASGFGAGESIEVTLTNGIQSINGVAMLDGFVTRFTAAAGQAPANFTGRTSTVGAAANDALQIKAGDLDGDGDLDLVALTATRLEVYRNDNGSFFLDQAITMSAQCFALGDLNRDGDLDVIVGFNGQDDRVYFGNTTNASFGTANPITGTSGDSRCYTLGDFDADGDLDAALGSFDGTNLILLNNGPGMGLSVLPFGPASPRSRDIASGDLDNDGDLDLVVARDNASNLAFINDGNGNFSVGATIDANAAISLRVALGDLNGDGALDVVFTNDQANDEIYFNLGNASFGTAQAFDTNANRTSGVVLADVDGVNGLDIITVVALGGANTPINEVRLNQGNGTFGAPSVFRIGSNNATDLVAADFDGDDGLDLAVAHFGQAIRVFWNEVPTQLTVAPIVVPEITETQAFSVTASAMGGVPPYTFALQNAPTWASIAPMTGILAGTAPLGVVGTHTFDVVATDSAGIPVMATRQVMISVLPRLEIVTGADLGMIGEAELFSVQLPATGGTMPYDWAVQGGIL